jgi:hypothetical protein
VILEEGIHKFECETPSFDWASVSSSALATVEVLCNGARVDSVYVHGPTHTWWSNNALFSPPLKDGDKVTIIIKGPAAMRIECVGLKRLEA